MRVAILALLLGASLPARAGEMGAGRASSSSITGIGPQTQPLDMNSNRIINVTDPTAAQDAATKNYVDNNTPTTVPDKMTRLGTAAALPTNIYANGSSGVGATLTGTGLGALTVDSVATAVGDRILVKNEADTRNNGIYQVTTTAGGAFYVLTRVADFNQNSEMIGGTLVVVDSGTTNTDNLYVLIATVAVVGTDLVQFARANIGDRAQSGANADISSLAGAGASVTFSTSVTFVSSVTIKNELTISSDVVALAGSTWVVNNVSLSTSAQSTFPALKLDPTSGWPTFGVSASTRAYPCGTIGAVDFSQINSTTSVGAIAIDFSSITIQGSKIVWHVHDRLKFWCVMRKALNANAVSYAIRIQGGNNISGSSGHTGNGQTINGYAELMMQSPGNWLASATMGDGSSSDTGPLNSAVSLTGVFALTETSDFIVNCRGTGVANGDVSFSYALAEYCPAPGNNTGAY